MKKILYFVPEEIIKFQNSNKCNKYNTSDFIRNDCDLKLDLSNMIDLENGTYDIVIAFDVLEHVPDYENAIDEVNRILTDGGWGIFTVPQKDDLLITYEDSTIVTPEDRVKHFGQWDHLRIFGDDFSTIIKSKGFDVITINESNIPKNIQDKYVISPPIYHLILWQLIKGKFSFVRK